MKLTDVIHSEAERQEPEKWGRIILHKEGKFIHAYEWSAWLIKQIVCTEEFQKQRGDQKMLSANRYKMKDGEYVMIGFPVESISKYIPNYNVLGNDGQASEDFYIDIDVSSLGSDFETLDLMFHTWKADCPEKEDKKKKDSQQQQAQALGRSGLFSIVSQIISYPAEATTPIQDKEFISRMKAQAASLL
jgi:hypothetical protein